MTAPEFYDIFREYESVLKKAGFKKKSRNVYLADDVQLNIILDKWGWLEEYGWGFLIRLTDVKGTKYGDPYAQGKDIMPATLIDDKLIKRKELQSLYYDYKVSHPGVYKQIDSGWFGFYTTNHLRQVLGKVLPLIGKSTSSWATGREAARNKPRAPIKRLTEAEKREIEKQVGGKFVT